MPDDYRDALLGPPRPALDLDAIRARRAAITRTPWSAYEDAPWVLDGRGHALIGMNERDDILDPENAAFIAAAPADIDTLLARVAELENTLATLRAGYAERRAYAEKQMQAADAGGDVTMVLFWTGVRASFAGLIDQSNA